MNLTQKMITPSKAASIERNISTVLFHHARRYTTIGMVTLFAFIVLTIYLSPLGYMTLTAVKSTQQITANQSLLPVSPLQFEYEGRLYDIYEVPTEEGIRQLALVSPQRTSSQFIDPQDPAAGLITWEGRWRTLTPVTQLDPQWSNFPVAFERLNFPRMFFNTMVIAVLGVIGTLVSCILVAYGFARFPIPGKGILFIILISTIILPRQVTLVPTYAFFAALGWTGTWLPLIVPHFFANAYNVFLLRQYFMTLPKELDEAAMIDGAGPMRILLTVIIPQAYPVIVAVGLFHFVFAWNDYFEPLIYLLNAPHLQPISLGIQQFNLIYTKEPAMLQASSILALIPPLILFVLAQRVFMRGIVVTGVDK
jgi:multiple sugar transport system permease protein